MKSILALLCIVALAHANIQKSGGLKGSWEDTIWVTSDTPDEDAPTITYDGTTDALTSTWFTDFNTNYVANTTLDGGQTIYFSFMVDNELTYGDNWYYYFSTTGGWEITFWTPLGDGMATLLSSCSIDYSDNSVYCYIYTREHLTPGDYKPMITVWDLNGNWASYDETAFTETGDQAWFTLAENDPDVTMPVLMTPTISEAAIVLGMEADIEAFESDTGGQTIIDVWINDGYDAYYSGDYAGCSDPADDMYDMNASGVWGVWATLTAGEDEDMWMWDVPLMYEECDDATGNLRYSAALWFYNYAEEAEFTVSIWGMDYAGNVGVATMTDDSISVTFDSTGSDDAGGAFSCQTVDLYLYSDFTADPEVVVTADTESESVIIYATCTEKDEVNYNYVAAAFTSEEYDAAGVTDPVTMTIWTVGSGFMINDVSGSGNFGLGVSYQSYDEDSWDYKQDPATLVSLGFWSGSVVIPPASPSNTDFMLSELDTVDSWGAIQRYNLAEGAAASVVPSVFAVLFAAVALLRL